jgi:hypothetical protein
LYCKDKYFLNLISNNKTKQSKITARCNCSLNKGLSIPLMDVKID